MVPGRVDPHVVADRLAWVQRMVAEIRALPLGDYDAFMADSRNVWTAESCLRRALEALFDLGRHILAREFGQGVAEYKAIARQLHATGVLHAEEARQMERMAGYRNRLVHLYHEVTAEELYRICTQHLDDVERVAEALRRWLRARLA